MTLDNGLLFGLGVPLLVAILAVSHARGAFRVDRFPSPWRRRTAFGLLFALLVATVILPAASLGRGAPGPGRISFGEAFLIQGLLASFLAAWWALSGRPPLLEFLGLKSRAPAAEAGAGICLGLIGWALTLIVGVVLAVSLTLLGLPGPKAVPPLIRWIAALSPFRRLLIVAAAMTFEEFYFRAFLQRRLGAVAASILFLLAHGGYGEPYFFVGLLAITSVLAAAYRRTGSTVAPILAHGTFDAIQIFIFLPMALKLLGGR